MANGVVKWFNPAKGFGFITPDDGGDDVFIRPQDVKQANVLAQQLEPGKKVMFEPVSTESGNVAASYIRTYG